MEIKPIANVYAIPLPDWMVNREHLQGLPQEVADFFEGHEVLAMLSCAPCLFCDSIGTNSNWYGVKLDTTSIVFYLEASQDTQPMIDHVNNFPKALYGRARWGNFGSKYSKVKAINYARERKARGKAINQTMASYELESGEVQEVETINDEEKRFSYRIK